RGGAASGEEEHAERHEDVGDTASHDTSLRKVIEHLYPSIIRIGDPDAVARIDEDSGGQPELAGTGALLTKIHQQLPGSVEDLHGFEMGIEHIQMILRIDRDALGLSKVAWHIALAADLADGGEVWAELLDAEVERIADVDAALAVEGDVGGVVELAE